ncbi:MAG: [FeFe] hydrogenase H-cluster radical SAM maturase HydG [Proteobacteria bacterium]|nr:[FeFe] hydrogenase H-cluster radical SAM maturase HydG [Pseudomonadota bacterium]
MLEFQKIKELSEKKSEFDKGRFDEIIHKSISFEELSLDEISFLLGIEDRDVVSDLCKWAFEIKRLVFGDRIVLFAPLYLSNECSNKCLYCGFQSGNEYEVRKTLSVEEAVNEAKFLTKRGFRRTLLVTAENKKICGVDYITKIVKALYDETDMNILHLNSAPMEVDELRQIREIGVGVFQVFQETYHEETYRKYHVSGKKKDFYYRLTCMDRALTAGFKDVGIGCLLGLYDYRFDVLATIEHAKYLKKNYGTYPHTISVPRLRYAKGALVENPPYPVDDTTFKKIVAVYRLAVPTSGIVISTREPALLRDEILECGASQISAESSTAPGGYTGKVLNEEGAQFTLNDTRSLEDVIISILEKNMLPSFCTSCYRKGREGGVFHDLAIKGHIKDFCEENAINTFLEYIKNLEDTAKKERMLELFDRIYKNNQAKEKMVCVLK